MLSSSNSIELRFIQTGVDDHIINIKKLRGKIVWNYRDPNITSHHVMYYDTICDVIETFNNLMESLKYDANPYTHIQFTIPAIPPVIYSIKKKMPGIQSMSCLIEAALKRCPVSMRSNEVNQMTDSSIEFNEDDEDEEEDDEDEDDEDEDEDEEEVELELEEEQEEMQAEEEKEEEEEEEEEQEEQNYVDDIVPLSWTGNDTEKTNDDMPPLNDEIYDDMPPLIGETDDDMPPLIPISKLHPPIENVESTEEDSFSYFS
jgi:flagellar biosynthesis GTPase FlhF